MNTLNQTPEHPANEELAAFALGKPTPNAETIAEHVANCARCETLIAKTPRDTFLSILNKAKPGSSLTGPNMPKSIPPSTDELPDELRQQTKYTFLKKLGGGGMGVVYLAEHNLMKRKVAVKLIPPEMIGNPAVRERFLREVVSAAALEHPNVVRAYSAEEFGPHMAFEMEFVDGKDLGQVVKLKGPLPVAHAANYIRQAAQALQHGMLKSMVHRDIKPGNLMLTRTGNVKVADFVLAKFSRETDKGHDRSLTGVNAMMGTPDYMAPEQARNAKSADIRADIYSLGCTFYYLLTGQPPFAGESVADLVIKHWDSPRPDVGLLRNDVPAELSRFIRGMMAKDPADRPQTPKEVVDWLLKFAKGGSADKETVAKPKETTVVDVKPEGDEIWNFPEITPEPEAGRTSINQKAMQPRKKWPLLVAGAIACLAILAATVVFRVKAKDGTIVLENLPADAEVTVDGGTATVPSDGKTFEIRVAADKKHRLEVKKDGFKTFGSEVEVDTGGRRSIVVRLEPIKTPDLAKLPKDTRRKEIEIKESTPSAPESADIPQNKNEPNKNDSDKKEPFNNDADNKVPEKIEVIKPSEKLDPPKVVIAPSGRDPSKIDVDKKGPDKTAPKNVAPPLVVKDPGGLGGRLGTTKERVLRDRGGDEITEAAVASALAWLAKQQNPASAFWEYDGIAKQNRIAATGMCLLPFLAAGETHWSGKKYKDTVARGLNYLKLQIKPSGELHPNMYAHAIATIALCEAVGMTKDPALKQVARKAVDYIIKGQAANGSWGYQAGTEGDTSIVGWQIQALHSAKLAEIPVPAKTFKQAAIFLESMSADSGSTYGYRAKGSMYTLSAVGLLCREYIDWNPTKPGLARGVDLLCTNNPPNENALDMYYYYYATQVVHYFDGPAWQRDWNPKIKRILLDKQLTKKNDTAAADIGSWPKDNGPHIGEQCGKLGTTALACLTLEVYYRHLPLYKRDE